MAFALIGVGLLLYSFRVPILQVCGQPIVATVARTSEHHGKGTTYYVYYSYLLGDRRVDDNQKIAIAAFKNLKAGQALDGKHLAVAGYDFSAVVAPYDTWTTRLWNQIFAVFWVTMTTSALVSGWLSSARQRQLFQNGDEIQGSIIDKKEQRGRHTTYTIHYTFHPRNSQPIVSKADVTKVAFNAAVLGDSITIFFSPANPKRNTILECGEFEIVR